MLRSLLLAFSVLSTTASAANCEIVVASDNLPFSQKLDSISGKPTDFGVRATGFIVDDVTEKVVHGIDVSKYQDETDFLKAYKCGARFAYIRLSGGTDKNNEKIFRVHWANARASGMLVGPYHNLSVLPTAIRRIGRLPLSQWKGEIENLLPKSTSSAKYQANIFLENLREVISLDIRPDPILKTANPAMLPVVIDSSFDPFPSGTPAMKDLYAPVYANMVCTWIKSVEEKVPNAKAILFTSPEIYSTYLSKNQCNLAGINKWIRYHPRTGGRYDLSENEAIREMCLHGASNKCIMQQYTSFGGFALYNENASLDLNRFYGDYESIKSLLLITE